MPEQVKRESKRKIFQGTVVSDKMDKTAVVQVKWGTKHSKYHKVMAKGSKFKAHDEKNEAKTGDVVEIMETRPLSRDKRWIITSIVNKAKEV